MQEMERFLLEAQQQALLATARAVATALHERPQLMRVKPAQDSAARQAAEESLRQAAERADRTGQPAVVEEIGRESVMSEQQSVAEISAILRGLERSTARIWVVNRELKLLALAGSLKPQATTDSGEGRRRACGATSWRASSRARTRISTRRSTRTCSPPGAKSPQRCSARRRRALRNSADGRAVIVSAAHPIWGGDDVRRRGGGRGDHQFHTRGAQPGARAPAARRPSWRSRWPPPCCSASPRACRTASAACATRRRARSTRAAGSTRLTSGSQAGDEIGDLSRSFSAVLEKLSQHHGYLESMAGRLSHELRTPIAVVRSSLENLEAAAAARRRRRSISSAPRRAWRA